MGGQEWSVLPHAAITRSRAEVGTGGLRAESGFQVGLADLPGGWPRMN